MGSSAVGAAVSKASTSASVWRVTSPSRSRRKRASAGHSTASRVRSGEASAAARGASSAARRSAMGGKRCRCTHAMRSSVPSSGGSSVSIASSAAGLGGMARLDGTLLQRRLDRALPARHPSPVRSPLDAARELAPRIRSAADEIEAKRELPRELFEALADAGLFHLALPRSLGFPERDPPTYCQVMEVLAQADASTAWAVNQGAIFATYAARMPRETAPAIFADTPRAVVANTPAPTATAVIAPGGYRVTGRQGFSTGCRHAAWVAAHAQVVVDGQPRRLGDGQPDVRYLFVPVAEAELLDTWHVRGMRGTGTHHFAVHDVFVPAERTVLSVTAPLI